MNSFYILENGTDFQSMTQNPEANKKEIDYTLKITSIL